MEENLLGVKRFAKAWHGHVRLQAAGRQRRDRCEVIAVLVSLGVSFGMLFAGEGDQRKKEALSLKTKILV